MVTPQSILTFFISWAILFRFVLYLAVLYFPFFPSSCVLGETEIGDIAERAVLKSKVREAQLVQPLPWGEVRALAQWAGCVTPQWSPLNLALSGFKQAGLALLSWGIHGHGTELRPAPLLNPAVGWKQGLSADLRQRIWPWILQEGPCTREISGMRSTELFWRLLFLPHFL